MAGRPAQHSREEFVTAALALIDSDGYEALTARNLGTRIGVHATAIYRYFPARDDLITAVVDRVFGEIAQLPPNPTAPPREQLLALMLHARTVLLSHANITIPLVTSSGLMPNGAVLMLRVLDGLETLGLHGPQLVAAYQALESYVIGATAFDLAAAPENVAIRQQRYALLGHPDFAAAAKTVRKVAASNEAAFRFGCEAMLDSYVVLAGRPAPAPEPASKRPSTRTPKRTSND